MARPLLVAAACLVLLAAAYALALGTDAVLRADRDLRFPQVVGDWRLRDAASWGFARAGEVIFGAGTAAVVGGALLASGARRALTAAAVIAAGPLAGVALAAALGAADPLGGEALRQSQGAFPSGHASFALSLGLGLVVALPARRRAAGGVAAVLVAAAMATGIMALGWHYPSDVAGGFLISIAGAAAVVAALCPGPPPGVRAAALGRLAAVALGAWAALGAVALWLLPDEPAGAFVDAHPRFIACCAGAALLALAGVAAVSATAGVPGAPAAPRAAARAAGPTIHGR
ncbi:phosphatase PAP2 family protein [Miltoncostaea marina]|uniref:phosphatase PAP2 family protein n=1 Tax=Miltoncostaea marina TaxID=2843215 RepID=UPI001C3E29F9|nr:phosphatase PAP2 family protein [Miltoncostaea marina]